MTVTTTSIVFACFLRRMLGWGLALGFAICALREREQRLAAEARLATLDAMRGGP